MESHPILLAGLVLLSAYISIQIWMEILRRPGRFWPKSLLLLISAIPFIGPVFFIFIDAPPVLPLSEQAKQFPKGTEVYTGFESLIASLKRFFS
ncbi:hypothetical protein ACO0LF_18730 [Undibacterium sp. Di27W]